jgi:hypothetical protein
MAANPAFLQCPELGLVALYIKVNILELADSLTVSID